MFGSHECHCVIHEPPADLGIWDDQDRKIVADAESHGWSLMPTRGAPSAPRCMRVSHTSNPRGDSARVEHGGNPDPQCPERGSNPHAP